MHTKQRPKEIRLMPAGVLFGRYFQIPNTYVAAKTILWGGGERLTQYVVMIHKYIKSSQYQAQLQQPLSLEGKMQPYEQEDYIKRKIS